LELEEDIWSGINYIGVTALTFASYLSNSAEKTSRLLRQPCSVCYGYVLRSECWIKLQYKDL